jgi:hypothetical protein
VDATETSSSATPRSLGWVWRAALEAALIVFGLVGALLIDEWRDSRERAERVGMALDSIRAELVVNHKAIQGAIANHETVMARLREAAKAGTVYQRGILVGQPFSSVAWEAARDGGITNQMDQATLMELGRVYRALDYYLDQRSLLLGYLYTTDKNVRGDPLALAGWLNDMTGAARGVEERLRVASRALGQPLPSANQPSTSAEPPPSPEKPPASPNSTPD